MILFSNTMIGSERYMDTFLQWNSSFYLTMNYIQSFLFSSGGSLLGQSEAK